MELSAASGGESIKVFVRVRPPDPNLSSEVDQGACLEACTQMSVTVYCKPEPRVFTFDHVAGMETTQEDVFSSIGRPIIDSCMCGYNGTIFAYGQTGSGKTFTMIGPSDECDTFTHELRGIIPRSFEYLFSHINREIQKFGDLVEFLCKCSFLEIYNEQVFDLLDPVSVGLHLRENIKHGVYVDGLSEVSVSCARDAYEVLSTGWVNRKVASTSMNRESSRSHAVFTLSIESKKRDGKNSVAKIKTSLLNLVDLAGSERQRDTHAAGLRLKEAGSINKSLSALGNVIMALVDIAHGKSRHVHYRDSKLTFLLRDSLGGNAKTNLVANVHPSARCFGETLSTLNFARRAKMIRNKAVVNEDASGNVLQLQAEIRKLREKLEQYRSSTSVTPSPVSTPLTPCPFPSSSSSSSSLRSDDEKAIAELNEMLSASMLAREKTESEKSTLVERLEHMEQLCQKKEKFLQSTKMILKFRETHIANLEKNSRSQQPESSTHEVAVNLLRQEIDQLKYMISHHPDVTKFARENHDLKAELKKLREATMSSRTGGVARQDSSKDLGRMHKYTLQLERQLRHFLAQNNENNRTSCLSLAGGVVAPPTPSKASLDLDHLRSRCKQLQEELEQLRRTLSSEREESHLKVSKLEATLNAAKKANMELERSIEALKLKSSVEKTTLNDIHMNTIKSMLTPRREREREAMQLSKSSPVGSPLRRADSDPVKQQLTFNRVLTSSAPTSPYRLADSSELSRTKPAGSSLVHSINKATSDNVPAVTKTEMNGDDRGNLVALPSLREEGEGCEDVESEGSDDLDELNIEGALTDELKILQDRSDGLHQQIEDLEVQLSHLSQEKSTLEAQLQEVTQMSRSENESAQLREQEYLEKISEMTAKIADVTSTNTVLDSEVVDLRVCLRSADRELAELKDDLKREKRTHDTRIMDFLRRIGELEQSLSSREADFDRATEQCQNVEVEVETLRDEMTFKEHRISELEQAFVKEKGQVTSLESEVQQLLDKLALEVEKNTKLSSELQEGHVGKEKFVSVVNENSTLQGKVEELESELQTQLRLHKKQMEETEAAMNSLMKRQSTDEAAIAGFMATIQELRGSSAMSEAKVSSLRQEVEESRKELHKTTSKLEQMSTEVESLHSEIEKERLKHDKDLMKKDSEREIVSEELDSLTEQYQQLESVFESQSSQLSHSNSEIKNLRSELEAKRAELDRLSQQDKERRASLSRRSSERDLLQTMHTKNEEIELLKRRLDNAAKMIDSYEQAFEEKNREIQLLKEEAAATERLRADYDCLLATHDDVKDRLSLAEEKLEEKEGDASLKSELERAKAQLEQLQIELCNVVLSRDKALSECSGLRAKRDGQRSTIDALNNQLERYKVHEEKLFIEKEDLRSQLEAIQEEKTKLIKECENLTKENATITGHRNIRQKIQYHAAIKMENSKLREEVIQLSGRLRHKSDQVNKLQHILSGKVHEGQSVSPAGQEHLAPPTGAKKPHLASKVSPESANLRLKENVAPS